MCLSSPALTLSPYKTISDGKSCQEFYRILASATIPPIYSNDKFFEKLEDCSENLINGYQYRDNHPFFTFSIRYPSDRFLNICLKSIDKSDFIINIYVYL